MARVAIVTDSTADLAPEVCARLGIAVVPLNVHFGEEVFRDQLDLTSDQFMERLRRTPDLPTTSQPSPGRFEQTFRELAADHDEIVAVLLSSKLSGTVQSALLARDAVADVIRVEVVDSLNASVGLGFQVLRAADLAAAGSDAAAIAARLATETGAYHLVFFVDTLEFLQRGGRIGRAAALVGSILSLKPTLRVDEGLIVPFERTRSRAKAIKGLAAFAKGLPRVERLAVLHSTTPEDAAALADECVSLLPRSEIAIAKFSPVIGTHVGPGAMGVAVFEGEPA